MKAPGVEHATLQVFAGAVRNMVNQFLIEQRSRRLMHEFLSGFYEKTGLYISVDQFEDYLKHVRARGLITKVNGQWRLPHKSLLSPPLITP